MKTGKSKSKNKDNKKQNSPAPHQRTINNLEDLQRAELSGAPEEKASTATSTDEDENEGLGDGNIGRSKHNILGK
jgi:hypothetical protein